ncbi:DgyrCDS12848 [Dimorphilus gyrociliatus]|uniref:uridine/cytidine kinase n=1 Tax=Dimorphilus gyrociliatus TaxID=2664684 RepID=A0A7I8W8X8_9ANNE|nr:DgyrCDS12848 [Dimorphilus gyrociliatus]
MGDSSDNILHFRSGAKMAASSHKNSRNFLNDYENTAKPFIIGVCGGTASGKTTVCDKIMEKLGEKVKSKVEVIAMESFYKDLDPEDIEAANNGQYNFDHPDAFDIELLEKTFDQIIDRKTVWVPAYDKKSNERLSKDKWQKVPPADVIIFEGILAFYFQKIRDSFHMKLFVDSDADTRLSRRVLNDTEKNGRGLENVLNQYTQFVKPAFEEFCLPTKQHSDVIIPRGSDNTVAVDLIVQHIEELMKPRVESLRDRHNSDSITVRPH